MKRIDYVKCSLERKDCFKVITIIESDGNTKWVKKRAAHIDGREHVENMLKYSELDSNYETDFVSFLPCRRVDDGIIEYDFLNGFSVTDKVCELVQEKNWEELVALIESIAKVIYCVKDVKPFEMSSGFQEYFGDVSEIEGLPSAEMINIDMTTDNIIIDDEGKWNIIDYEWVMPFLVPLKYVLFRTIFFQKALSNLPKDVMCRVKDICEISETDWDTFYKMELKFQSSISDFSVNKAYNRFGEKCFSIDENRLNNAYSSVIVEDDNSDVLFREDMCATESEMCIEVQVNDCKRVTVQFCETGCVVKLKLDESGLNVDQITDSTFDLQINDDFYFCDKSVMTINVEYMVVLRLKFVVMHKNNEFLKRMVELLKSEYDLSMKNIQNLEWIGAYKSKVAKLEQELLKLGDDYSVLSMTNSQNQLEKETILKREMEIEQQKKEIERKYNNQMNYVHNIKSGKIWQIFSMLKYSED